MPQPETDSALKWKVETENLAASEEQMETAAISQRQRQVTNKYLICQGEHGNKKKAHWML